MNRMHMQRVIMNIKLKNVFPSIDRFQDLEGKLPDEEAQTLLQNLKENRLPSALPSQNIFKYTVGWREGGLHMENNEHAQYIDSLVTDFKDKWMDLIDDCLEKR